MWEWVKSMNLKRITKKKKMAAITVMNMNVFYEGSDMHQAIM